MLSRVLAWLETRRGFLVAVGVLSVVFAAFRFIRITFPASRVFDEVYSPKFAWDYLQGKEFFDVHPFLAEVPHMIGLSLFGDTPLGWRFSPWLWGILFTWGAALAARFLTGRRLVGVLAALLVSLDTAFFIYGRTGLPDMFLLSQFSLALACFFLSTRLQHRGWATIAAVASGVFLGNVVATKWLGLAGIVSIWTWIFLQLTFRTMSRMKRTDVILSSSEGSRDPSVASLPQDDKWKALLPNISWWLYPVCFLLVPGVTYGLWLLPLLGWKGSLPATWSRMKEWHWQVWRYHKDLTATHPYGSKWYQWPILQHPVLFFWEAEGTGRRMINATGNFILWWAGFAALIGSFLVQLRRVRIDVLWLSVSALLFWLPWAFISRVSFNYHYFTSFFFEVLLLSIFLVWLLDHSKHRATALTFLLVALGGFVLLYPTATGLWIPNTLSGIRFLFP